MHHRRNKGFISLRTILALFVVMSMMPISSYALITSAKLKFDHNDLSSEIALLQLRRILNVSYDIENYNYYLNFLYHGKTYNLELINNRLVMSPGYQMFLDDIDDLSFIEEGNVIYVLYWRKGKEYKAAITKSNGIYLDDFYDYDDANYSD